MLPSIPALGIYSQESVFYQRGISVITDALFIDKGTESV